MPNEKWTAYEFHVKGTSPVTVHPISFADARTVIAKCRGISPCLMDKVDTEPHSSGKRDNRSPEKMAAEKIYRDENGLIGFPVHHLVLAMANAISRIRERRFPGYARRSSALVLEENVRFKSHFLVFTNIVGDEEGFWKPDIRRGSSAGSPNQPMGIVRPLFPEWEFEVELEYNAKNVEAEKLQEVLSMAGLCHGLGSFSPAGRDAGPFGQFEIVSWKEIP